MRYILIIILLGFYSCKDKQKHDSLLGQWQCEEFRESGDHQQYFVTILHDDLSKDSTMYIISNFYQMGLTEEAYVRIKLGKNGELTIPNQIVMSKGISGSGKVEADFSEINLTYFIQSGSVNEQVDAIYN
jgi:hypothetical protein